MSSNPARRQRRAARQVRQPTRMTEYQRDRQAEEPRGLVRVHAHLKGMSLADAVEADEAAAALDLADADDEMPAAVDETEAAMRYARDATAGVRKAVDDLRAKITPAKPPRVDGNPYDTEFARLITAGLQTKAIYQDSVQDDVIHRRRVRNRAARRARRIARAA